MLSSEIFPLSLFLVVVGIIYLQELHLLFRFVNDKLLRRRPVNYFFTKTALIVHFLAITGILCFAYAYFVEPYRLTVTRIEITTDKIKHADFRIVQISDLHCDKKIRNEYKLVEQVNKLKPDIVIFTGDSVNSPEAVNIFRSTIRALKAKLGKVAVSGNFDVSFGPDLNVFANTDLEVLDRECRVFSKNGDSIYIYGLGMYRFVEAENFLKEINPKCFNIFLYHTPDLIKEVEDANVDLYLAGHTHGGQVALPIYGALVTFSEYGKKYEAGRYDVGNTILYVNRGIGMEGGIPIPRVRFLSIPEITVFDIKAKK